MASIHLHLRLKLRLKLLSTHRHELKELSVLMFILTKVQIGKNIKQVSTYIPRGSHGLGSS